jgi:hypothetical protein
MWRGRLSKKTGGEEVDADADFAICGAERISQFLERMGMTSSPGPTY